MIPEVPYSEADKLSKKIPCDFDTWLIGTDTYMHSAVPDVRFTHVLPTRSELYLCVAGVDTVTNRNIVASIMVCDEKDYDCTNLQASYLRAYDESYVISPPDATIPLFSYLDSDASYNNKDLKHLPVVVNTWKSLPVVDSKETNHFAQTHTDALLEKAHRVLPQRVINKTGLGDSQGHVCHGDFWDGTLLSKRGSPNLLPMFPTFILMPKIYDLAYYLSKSPILSVDMVRYASELSEVKSEDLFYWVYLLCLMEDNPLEHHKRFIKQFPYD